MKKTVKIILPPLLWFLIGINAFPQYYVKVKGDSTRFEIDSVALAIAAESGNIIWESSKDSLTWVSLDQYNDSLFIRIDSCAYYRAVLSDGTCYPVNSAVALVAFKSIIVTGNTVLIDTIGGVYTLPSGIKLIVPPGAVNENITASFQLLDSINADLKIPFDGDTGKVYCTGIYSEPAGTKFLKLVRIRIPATNFQHNDLPYVYLYDSNTRSWEKNTGPLTCSENLHFIEFSTDRLVSARVHLYKDLFVFGKSGESTKLENDCQEGFIHVETSDYDYHGQQGSSECYVNSDNTKITFLSCPGAPEQTAQIKEIGKNCKVVVTDDIDKITCLENGDSATVTVKVTIGGMPLKDQNVDFNFVPYGLAITPTSVQNTNDNGEATFKVKCHIEKFSGDIEYKVNYKYYLEIIQASAAGVTGSTMNFEQKGIIPKKQHIKPCSQVTRVNLSGDNYWLRAGGTDQLECKCYDKNYNEVDCGEIVYSVVTETGSYYPEAGAVTVDPSGLVSAIKPGVAKIRATASGIASQYDMTYSVSYQGNLNLDGVMDWNLYNGGCGCRLDYDNYPHIWKWYVITYKLRLHFDFWLSRNIAEYPSGDVDGTNEFIYTIDEPSYCKDTTIVENVDGFDFTYNFSTSTTQSIVSGAEFGLNYCYWDYRGFGYEQLIGLDCKMISPGSITVHVRYYWPEDCVRKVYPEDFTFQ